MTHTNAPARTGLVLKLAGLLIAGLLLTACQSISSYYRGYRTDAANRIDLPSTGEREGKWRTFDLTLDYRLKRVDDQLQIDGDARLSLHYQLTAIRLKHLDLYLFFLDKEGRVVETARLATALTGEIEQPVDFARRLKLPESTSTLAFGYDGVAYADEGPGPDGGSGGGGVKIFHELPKRPES